MAKDGFLTDNESLYKILTKDAILTEAMNNYLINAIAFYDRDLLHTILCMYIDRIERNNIYKEKDIIISEVQFMIANKRVSRVMKECQVSVDCIKSRYKKRYDIARNRYSCYLAALYMEHEPNIEYQAFINDIVKILGITPQNQLWGCKARIRSIFNKFKKRGK